MFSEIRLNDSLIRDLGVVGKILLIPNETCSHWKASLDGPGHSRYSMFQRLSYAEAASPIGVESLLESHTPEPAFPAFQTQPSVKPQRFPITCFRRIGQRPLEPQSSYSSVFGVLEETSTNI
ncbi:hypothetical protein O181_008521 [Austropuccinia psidii MF-1]|uniref:Uncharacterized protein n=1 Tax=Austropuccinia psidii MF-1 TaxID=1389203 RepID=A0A9Q3GIL3_9BASI|nr:hypothetical protein [Austropuccinia psidii MF-1]